LLGITSTREPSWLARFIKTPEKVLADKDPIATQLFARYKQVQMPNLRLGDGDVNAIIRYLASQSQKSASPQPQNTQMDMPQGMKMAH
jgi:protein SCO1